VEKTDIRHSETTLKNYCQKHCVSYRNDSGDCREAIGKCVTASGDCWCKMLAREKAQEAECEKGN
jgi:hypothetical protein